MNQSIRLLPAGLAAFCIAVSAPALAESRDSATASRALSGAVATSVASGTAVVGLSVALPMIAIGEVGKSIGGAARSIKTPFPIDDPSVTIGPAPDQILKP